MYVLNGCYGFLVYSKLIFPYSKLLFKLSGFVPSVVGLFFTFLQDKAIGVKTFLEKYCGLNFLLYGIYIFSCLAVLFFLSISTGITVIIDRKDLLV